MMRGGVCFPRLKKGGLLMKLNHPAKRLTAALLSGAMLFTLSAPALAADSGTAPDAAPAAAAPLNEENGSEDVVLTTKSQTLRIQWNNDPIDLTPASFTDDEPTVNVGNALSVTYADGVYTVAINNSSSRGSLNITGYTGQDGKQPSVVFVSNDAELTSLNVKGSKNFTAESNSGKAIDCSGDVIIDCGGDVTISSTVDKAISCAKNVNITSGGNVNITSTGSAIESREASITSGGDVTITSSDGNAISCYGAATINCSGNVTVNSSSATDFAVDGNALIIENAQDVTITAQKAIFHGYINSSAGFADSPAVRITCSGEVTLKSTGAGDTLLKGLLYIFDPGSASQTTSLTYNQANSYAYEVWADNAPLTDKGEAGTSFTLSEDTTYSSIHIIPGVPAPIIPGDGGDGTGIAGAVVAGVAIGGAAAWGSYEIATRVILNNLLPEGAAIPANRGQLALLVWNTAGRPAPAAAPAFADVTDPDTAAAAQWCVEQGYLDAKKDGKFDPDGWTPKFRVIEVWNKAFPKQ